MILRGRIVRQPPIPWLGLGRHATAYQGAELSSRPNRKAAARGAVKIFFITLFSSGNCE